MVTTIPLSQYLSFWVALFFLAILPGMGVVNVINFTVTQGWKKGLVAAWGTISADFIYILLATVGSSLVMVFFSHYGNAVKWIGVAVLVAFSLEKFFKKPRPVEFTPKDSKGRIGVYLFSLGLSLSNPKVFLFYFAFLPGFFDLGNLVFFDVFFIIFTASTALITAFSLVVVFSGFISRYLVLPSRMRIFNAGVGMILLFFAWKITLSLLQEPG